MRHLSARIYRENQIPPVRGQALATGLISFVMICSILYLGRDIIVPAVLAILLSILLAPVVKGLQRFGVPKPVAILAVVTMTFLALLLAAAMVAATLTRLATDLPQYESHLREKAHTIGLFASGGGTIERAANVLKDLQTELGDTSKQSGQPTAAAKPVQVKVLVDDFGPLQPIVSIMGFVIHPITQLGIVILLVFFFLFNREDLRDRIIQLAGARDLPHTTIAIDEAGERLTHLFTAQMLVNLLAGAVIGTGLTLIGVPGGLLWGALTAVLRFIPYIGTWMSAVFPLIIAMAIGDGWALAMMTAALVLSAEVIIGQVVEPLFFGKMTGLSPTAIVAAATFWSALWGPIGLVLATPITIGILVLGKHIEALDFLELLLGSRHAMPPDQTFYQRLLADDALEAAGLAVDFERDDKLDIFVTSVMIPALLLAQRDCLRHVLDRRRLNTVASAFSECLEEIWGDDASGGGEAAPVLLVPAPGALNFAATLAYSAWLTIHEIPHHVLPDDSTMLGRFPVLDMKDVGAICLCYLSAPSPAQVGYLARRLTQQTRQNRLIVLAWSGTEDRTDIVGAQQATDMLPSCNSADAPTAGAPAAATA
jgi:predicted PurR-regulated permease PerM